MARLKLPVSLITFTCALGWASFGLMPVQAQTDRPVMVVQPATTIFNLPPPPDDFGEPGDRVGGGKRGCKDDMHDGLTALVPVYSGSKTKLVLGLTTAEHPTFWFYIPDSSTVPADFVLQDEAENTIYNIKVKLPGTPGAIGISIPSTAAPLVAGNRYHWYFNIYCQPGQPPIYVDGWIQKVELNSTIKSQLDRSTPQQRVALYAANGIWYDALTASAELRRLVPNSHEWYTLLKAIGLNDIASEPIGAVP